MNEDFLYSDQYKMHENVYGGFVEYDYKNKNIFMSVGLRLEYTDFSTISRMNSQEYIYNRMDYFPFFSIKHKFSSVADISLRLASGIERPHFWTMFPIIGIFLNMLILLEIRILNHPDFIPLQ